MTDREMLELAAKAADLHVKVASNSGRGLKVHGNCNWWNPLTDDGDALRLAVKLQLEIYIDHRGVAVRTHCGLKVLESECHAEATRRAITIAAAKIGKEMK